MEHWILTLTNDDQNAVKAWHGANIETTSNPEEFLKFDSLQEALGVERQINAELGAGTVGTSGPRK